MSTAVTPSLSDTRPATASAAPGRDAPGRDANERPEAVLLAPVDLIEDAGGLTLYADLPGVPRENLQLRVEGDQLSIDATMALDLPAGMNPLHAEVTLSRYRRRFTLSKELDAEQVSAELQHGVLRVRIPKAAHAQPRRIEVRVA